jgi:hypothetical protein
MMWSRTADFRFRVGCTRGRQRVCGSCIRQERVISFAGRWNKSSLANPIQFCIAIPVMDVVVNEGGERLPLMMRTMHLICLTMMR